MSHRPNTSAFLKLFNSINPYGNRYDVFRDFVTMSALSLHNAFHRDPKLEAEYMSIVKRYDREAVFTFPKLLKELINLLEPEPVDILGQLYMQLEFGKEHVGQFFTPEAVSLLMANMALDGNIKARLESQEFISVNEPACGSGGMVLAFAKLVIQAGHNPAKVMWALCQDVDRTAALMCYVQLTLWNIPAVVIVGNTLKMECREQFYTPAYWMGFWNLKLKRREAEERAGELLQQPTEPEEPKEPKEPEEGENMTETTSGQDASPMPSPSPRGESQPSRIPSPLKIQASFDFDL